MLLDVQMPKLDGFEVLELLGRDQPVIFITAYDRVRAEGVRGPRRRLPAEAVQRGAVSGGHRARAERLRAKTLLPVDDVDKCISDGQAADGTAPGASSSATAPTSTCCRSDKIDYVEAQDDYVAFKSEGKQYLKDQTLSAVEETLDPSRFVRIHRSFILNIDRISKVELYAKDSRMAILRDGTRLPVSRAGYARLSQLL